VRSDVLDPAQKYKAMIESKEDQNDVLLDEITTRFRKSNRLVGWAGVVIAFLALMAATESKWMPLLESVPWFKKAPAQIEGGSVPFDSLYEENVKMRAAALKVGFQDYAVSFDKQDWLEVSNRIFYTRLGSHSRKDCAGTCWVGPIAFTSMLLRRLLPLQIARSFT
jgi:hypothetical protein